MDKIIDERVVIDSDIKIGATISYIDKSVKRPLILLIMGTGTMDRDGNGHGLKLNLYKDLSDMFVKMGYVCIRYDKRGTHESTGNFKTAGLHDLVNDSASVIEYAKGLEYVDSDRIIACGHSEGAMVATLLTKQSKLDSIILLCGAATCMKSALLYQNELVINEFKSKKGFASWLLNKLVTVEKVEKQVSDLYRKAAKAKGDRFFFRGAMMSTAWVKEHGELTDDDFVKMIEEYEGRVLAITGKSDVQADYNSLDKIKEFANVTTYSPDKVNHILREVNEEESIVNVKSQYVRLSKEPIYEGVGKAIEEFLDIE